MAVFHANRSSSGSGRLCASRKPIRLQGTKAKGHSKSICKDRSYMRHMPDLGGKRYVLRSSSYHGASAYEGS